MAERVRVARGGFNYPVGADSLKLIAEAGGLSKLSPDALKRVTMKRVDVGDFCDDMPLLQQAIWLESGELERVKVDDAPAAKTKKGDV